MLVTFPRDAKRAKSSDKAVIPILACLFLAAGLGAWTGCSMFSSAASSAASSPQVSIAISPTTASIAPGGSQQFSAAVSGASDTAATWSTTAGSISGNGLFTAPATASATLITVTATSVADNKSMAGAAVTVTTSPPSISTNSLPAAAVGTSYSATLQAVGGELPYQWSIGGGSLPTGIVLDASNGGLTGIPGVAGQSSFVVTVSDQSGRSAQQNLMLMVTAPPGAQCGPPKYSCSRNDFDVLIPTAPPQLGSNPKYYGGHAGAGTVAVDPAYGNRILRVTDGNTDSTAPGMSFGTSWSAEANLISSDESLFFVTNEGETPCLFQFDPAAFQASFHGCEYDSGAGNLQFGYTPSDASAFYNYSGPYLYRFQIDRSTWTISSDTAFNQGQGYFDPDGPQCLDGKLAAEQPWYVHDTSLSSDDSTFIADLGRGQDLDRYVVAWNATKGCRWMNVKTWEVSAGWNTGLSNPAKIIWVSGQTPTSGGGMHNVELDRSGQYAVLTINNTSLTSKVFWDLDTDTVNDTCTQCWSHWACDFDLCFWSFGPSSQGFQFRDLAIFGSTNMSSMMGNPDIPAIPSQPSAGNDEHAAHQNAESGQRNIYLVEESADSGAFTVGGLWDNELIGVNWDGSKRIVRFNKTWSSGFAGCPISRLGNFAICSSDYQMYNKDLGFGNGLNQSTCDHTATPGRGTTGCRHDVLLLELR
jgi:putative Ig domain-containing protein